MIAFDVGEPEGLRERLFDAHTRYQLRQGRQFVSLAEVGRLLARWLGADVPQPTVNRWFSGETRPKEEAIDALCALYEITRGWLVYGEGAMLPPQPSGPETQDPDRYRAPLVPLRETVSRERENKKTAAKKQAGRRK